MEEWPSRGKALERHDGTSSHCRVPVARPQGLKEPTSDQPARCFPFASEFNISLSAPCPQCIPPNLELRTRAADNACHLFVLRPLWYPLPSVLGTPFLNFTRVRLWFPLYPPLIPLSELRNVFDVLTYFLFVPFWELVVYVVGFFFFFFPRYPFSLFRSMLNIPSVHDQSCTSWPPWIKMTNQKWIQLIFQLSSMIERWAAFKHASECDGCWPVRSVHHLTPVLQREVRHSAVRHFVQVPFLLRPRPSLTSHRLLVQHWPMGEWSAALHIELHWNWTLSLNSCFSTSHSFLWHYCKNSPLAGTPFVVCACCGWCAVTPNEVLETKQKTHKGREQEHFKMVQ